MTLFFQNPSAGTAHVLLVYRNFAAQENPRGQCHIGLGVNALHTTRVLRRNGVDAHPVGVWTVAQLRARLLDRPQTTHCVIEAPWVPTADLERLLAEFQNVHFLVRSHSQIGFLQVEAGAIQILRDLLFLQDGVLNLTVSANSHRLQHYLEKAYSGDCLYLPNLYDTRRVVRKADLLHTHRTLRIGSFGALRWLKNHTTAAAAALLIARSRASDLEFWISVNREEGGQGILDSLRNMFRDLPWAKLIEYPWEDWSKFRRTVSHMDLCLHPSLTETFSIVTADAIAEGVPVVTSPAIEWVPDYFKVEPDGVEEIARVGNMLLSSVDSAADGLRSLDAFVQDGVKRWLAYLNSPPGNFAQAA